jgi:hypothetical protein
VATEGYSGGALGGWDENHLGQMGWLRLSGTDAR